MQIKQFVPSSVCLKCDGCCRFQLADSPWRPKTGQQEAVEGTEKAGYVKTVARDGRHQCVHFNHDDNTCGVYAKRPFECSLYPFVLSKSSRGIELFVHLACPYVQENQLKPEIRDYADYLKEFFNQPRTKTFLKNNSRLLHDYSPYKKELQHLFSIEG